MIEIHNKSTSLIRYKFVGLLTCLIMSAGIFCAVADDAAAFEPKIIRIHDESELHSLEEAGVRLLRHRGDIYLCLFPLKERMATSPSRIRRITPSLDVAKTYYDAFAIQDGRAAGIPYTGNGVVVGICDIGIDPLHPTFLDADGKSRIKRVVQYKEKEGIRIQLDGDDAYQEWKTDDPDKYHATHVCGILAGSGAGTPYSGIATDAEIVATVSTLSEVGLLAGVEDIIDYAREVGKPAVINISVGCNTGPHDGTSLFSQYLDMCADDAVIVLSAGNEGSHNNTIMHTFSDAAPSVSFRLGNTAWDEFHMYGATEMWSGSSRPLSVILKVYDSVERRIAFEIGEFTMADGDEISFSWDESDFSAGLFPLVGELVMSGEVSPENGRHFTTLAYDFQSPEPAEGKGWARYEFAVEVAGKPGEDVEVYADGTYTRLVGLAGSRPSPERSISDLACGRRVISAGMYGNRSLSPETSDGEIIEVPTRYEEAATVVHSSYGTLRDGRVTPLTVAPGAPVVSAYSRYYRDLHADEPYLDLGSPWLSESGTSMASPYIAGYIATWLEAVPGLTTDDVIRIILDTNRTDFADNSNPHNGMGWFDPVVGLRRALGWNGVDSAADSIGMLSPDEYVEVYSMTGAKIYAGAAKGLSGMSKGLYVVRLASSVMKVALP